MHFEKQQLDSHHILLSKPSTTVYFPILPQLHSANSVNSLSESALILDHSCPIHSCSLSFISPFSNLTYSIQTHAMCHSSNLVYPLTCTQCDGLYVRETRNSLSTRMNGHFSYTKSPNNLHFQQPFIPELLLIDCVLQNISSNTLPNHLLPSWTSLPVYFVLPTQPSY